MKRKNLNGNYKFLDSYILNSETYQDYFERLKKVALSIYEWQNLPDSMDSRYLEETLFFFGKATLLKDKNYGFINTKCAGSGYINIYGLPTKLNCFSYGFNSIRKLYTGLNPTLSDKQQEQMQYNECILVGNNWDFLPTSTTIELFAYRLAEAEMTAFTNIKAQKTPVMILCDEKQRLTMENLYNQYNGNQPFIFGNKNLMEGTSIQSIKTEAPFIADKIMDYKKEIWTEALTYLGINNIMVEKKERMITDEANQNNELINLNLESYLAPRQKACKDFNEKFGLTGTDKEISVKVRSDLRNIVKQVMSTTNELIDENNNLIDDRIEEKEGGANE